jgi:hypothetical protein
MIRVADVFMGVDPAQSEAEVEARAEVWVRLRAGPRQAVPQGGATTGPAMSLGERQAAQGTSAEWARWLWPDGLPRGVR